MLAGAGQMSGGSSRGDESHMVARLAADSITLDQPREYGRHGSDARARSRRFFRTAGLLSRPREADPGYGPPLGAPDQVENDYYRFLNHPRD